MHWRLTKTFVAFVALSVLVVSCKQPAPNMPIAEVWQTRCAKCHGTTGAGDGDAAMRLDPKPRDLRDPAWHQARSDDMIGRVIIGGGAALGRSGLMPPHADLASRKEDLVKWVRGLAKK